ncbi:MAG: signal peptidase II [Dehalococcoidales bacterium]|nr:signal peptidase II [Dehalococcoidales bacterium]
MQKAGKSTHLWRNLLVLLIILLIVAGDQLSKAWIRSFPLDGETICNIGFIAIVHWQNTGIAFGMLQGQILFLKIISIVGLVGFSAIGIFVTRRYPYLANIPNRIAFALTIGGTIGNLIDRWRFGRVTDFIDPGFFPAFNVADSALTIGVIMILISLLYQLAREKHLNSGTPT